MGYRSEGRRARPVAGAGQLFGGHATKGLKRQVAGAETPQIGNQPFENLPGGRFGNFVASYQLDLPFGVLVQKRNQWTEGWSISGITRLSTGLPVTLFNNNDTSLLGTIPNGINSDGVDTPDYTPGDSG